METLKPNGDKIIEEKIHENIGTEMREGLEPAAEQGEGEMTEDFDFVNSRQGSTCLLVYLWWNSFVLQLEVLRSICGSSKPPSTLHHILI